MCGSWSLEVAEKRFWVPMARKNGMVVIRAP